MGSNDSASEDDEFPPYVGLNLTARERSTDVILCDGMAWFLTAEVVRWNSVFHGHVVSPVECFVVFAIGLVVSVHEKIQVIKYNGIARWWNWLHSYWH